MVSLVRPDLLDRQLQADLELMAASDRLPGMTQTPPIVLTVAGFDPSAGAGVTADLKTIAAHGCYGVACITALTVQSTKGVRRVEPVEEKLVGETLEELAGDFEIAAMHIGMLGTAGLADTVSRFLSKHRLPNVVLDPVLRSSSGAELLNDAGMKLLIQKLLPLVTVMTPNLDEASCLTGLPVTNIEGMKGASERLHSLGAKAVVVTGGHLDPAIDLLSYTGEQGMTYREFHGVRQRSRSTHGTGCAFATALACQLALGRQLVEAVPLAKSYVEAAIANAYPLGGGVGPVNHLYGLVKTR